MNDHPRTENERYISLEKDVSYIKDNVGRMAGELQKINEGLPAIRNDVNLANQMIIEDRINRKDFQNKVDNFMDFTRLNYVSQDNFKETIERIEKEVDTIREDLKKIMFFVIFAVLGAVLGMVINTYS